MRRLAVAGLVAGLAGLAGLTGADDKKGDPADPLVGKWVVEQLTQDGKKTDRMKGATRVHQNGEYTLDPPPGKGERAAGKYQTDPGKSPKHLDMVPSTGKYKDQTLAGIYKVDGDTLTICFAEAGKERPTAFESKPGSGLVLAVHKRAK